MSVKDDAVVKALGPAFADLQRLARAAYEDPSSRAECEVEMGKILRRFSPKQLAAVRRALLAAGAYKGAAQERTKRRLGGTS